jgi:hypothetical protein
MHTFFVGNQPEPSDRTQISVNDNDAKLIHAAMRRKPFIVEVYDYKGKKRIFLADEDCGLGCRCALRFVEML